MWPSLKSGPFVQLAAIMSFQRMAPARPRWLGSVSCRIWTGKLLLRLFRHSGYRKFIVDARCLSPLCESISQFSLFFQSISPPGSGRVPLRIHASTCYKRHPIKSRTGNRSLQVEFEFAPVIGHERSRVHWPDARSKPIKFIARNSLSHISRPLRPGSMQIAEFSQSFRL